ncbi:adenylate cyclase [Exophiala aquamarina CBS 119918]|uniref:Adenylate cyclase n=1 Tax=Exophiala aquamarina CBS 119918 TaxID=1182545 RepID=A0A072P4M0_9EURO|nr:adenylate cyclase [Exophiala aquamarina CBS 119918]KEF54662.1 adenylate cyclase [Exophiala aquamarina CBS 119918]
MFLEVERKFSPSAVALIARNAGCPPFKNFTTLPTTAFRDTYFDLETTLRDQGMWLRRRGNDWELKVKTGGDFINSSFQEISGTEEIEQTLTKHFPRASLSTPKTPCSSNDGRNTLGTLSLAPFAEITTTRQAWIAQTPSKDILQIVVDTTDFGHRVGEVELAWDGVDTAAQDSSRLKMDQIVSEFMNHHKWAFPDGKCKGKLSAYFEWRETLAMDGAPLKTTEQQRGQE